jgi:hypothetical protein
MKSNYSPVQDVINHKVPVFKRFSILNAIKKNFIAIFKEISENENL